MKRINKYITAHGSDKIQEGKLVGSTDTDYFYFFCPKCNDTHVMQVVDFGVITDEKLSCKSTDIDDQRKKEFSITFKLYCEKCKLSDFVKISNMGFLGGKLTDRITLDKLRGKTLQWI